MKVLEDGELNPDSRKAAVKSMNEQIAEINLMEEFKAVSGKETQEKPKGKTGSSSKAKPVVVEEKAPAEKQSQ